MCLEILKPDPLTFLARFSGPSEFESIKGFLSLLFFYIP